MQVFEQAKEGLIDCIKYDKHTFCWSRAHLLFKGSNDSSIRYLNSKQEAIVSNNREIMLFNSRTNQQYDQLLHLKIDDPIDLCDANGNWILTKIIDRKET
jgi:hypothetical protein